MEKRTSGIMISKSSFASRTKLIDAPGVYEIEAGNSNLIFDENLGKEKYIVNLKAVPAHKLDDVKALFAGKEEVGIEELNGLTMTANIIVNGNESAPMPGQKVKISVDYVDNKDKTAQVLAVKSISVPKAKQGKSIFVAEETGRLNATDNATVETEVTAEAKPTAKF